MSTPALISIRNLTVSFRDAAGRMSAAVRSLGLDIPTGGTLGLVGESGSGKSVTALALLGLLPRESAEIDPAARILYRGENLLAAPAARIRALRGGTIGMVFQDPMTALDPVFPVGFQIGEVLRLHAGMSARAAARRAVELIDEVGIAEPARRARDYPHRLSGGQQQRVMIAMALAGEPELLVADEPTTALDVTVQRQILELLARLRSAHGTSMLFISHDLALTAEIADRVAVLRAGALVEEGTVADVFERPQAAYTRALLECRPTLGRRRRRLPIVDDVLAGRRSDGDDLGAGDAPAAGETVLEAVELAKDFEIADGWWSARRFVAVAGVSFALRRGRTLAVVGESGSGKTTLGLTLLGLYRPSSGRILFRGADTSRLTGTDRMRFKRAVQMVFQNPYASLNPRFTVLETLTEPLRIHGLERDERAMRTRARRLLDQVGLPDSALGRFPHEFSGGQRQRIAIARCLSTEPDVIVCDEAVSALDVSIQSQILNLLRDLQESLGLAYVFISHDLAATRHLAHDVVVLRGGSVVEAGTADEVYGAPRDPYTRELFEAVPRGLRAATGPGLGSGG